MCQIPSEQYETRSGRKQRKPSPIVLRAVWLGSQRRGRAPFARRFGSSGSTFSEHWQISAKIHNECDMQEASREQVILSAGSRVGDRKSERAGGSRFFLVVKQTSRPKVCANHLRCWSKKWHEHDTEWIVSSLTDQFKNSHGVSCTPRRCRSSVIRKASTRCRLASGRNIKSWKYGSSSGLGMLCFWVML